MLRTLLKERPDIREVHILIRSKAEQQRELREWLGRMGFAETTLAEVDLPEAPARGGPEEAQVYMVARADRLRRHVGEEEEQWEAEVETHVATKCRSRGGEAYEKEAVRMMKRHHRRKGGGDGRPMAARVPKEGAISCQREAPRALATPGKLKAHE